MPVIVTLQVLDSKTFCCEDSNSELTYPIFRGVALFSSFVNGFGFCVYYVKNQKQYPEYLCNFGYFVVVIGICFCLLPILLVAKVYFYDQSKHRDESFSVRLFRYLCDNKSELHQQVLFDRIKTAKSLIDSVADVNSTDYYGKSCLMTACSVGKRDMVQMLIENGADVNAKDKEGDSSIFQLKSYRDKKRRWIQTAKGSLTNNEDVEILKLLIEQGADVNVRDKDGITPLFLVSSFEVAEMLVENGAEVNIKDYHGNTLLYEKIIETNMESREKEEMIELLFKNGADVNIRDKKGRTALHLLTSTWPPFLLSSEEDLESAKVLLENGADVNIRDNKGKHAIDYAIGTTFSSGYLFNRKMISLLKSYEEKGTIESRI